MCIVNHICYYGADIINWTQSELASIKWAFNSATCKIYEAEFQQLDNICKYTCQLDIVDVIMRRHRNFLCNLWHSPNVIVRHLASMLSCSVVLFECVTFAIFCTYLSPVYHSTVQYSVNKGFYKNLEGLWSNKLNINML